MAIVKGDLQELLITGHIHLSAIRYNDLGVAIVLGMIVNQNFIQQVLIGAILIRNLYGITFNTGIEDTRANTKGGLLISNVAA